MKPKLPTTRPLPQLITQSDFMSGGVTRKPEVSLATAGRASAKGTDLDWLSPERTATYRRAKAAGWDPLSQWIPAPQDFYAPLGNNTLAAALYRRLFGG